MRGGGNKKTVAGQCRRTRRGAVALEYVLLAAFMAIALMGAFAYFRRTLSVGMENLSSAAAFTTSDSVKEAYDKLGTW